MTTRVCEVRGCKEPEAHMFDFPDGIPISFQVCDFHIQALNSGEPYELSHETDPRELLLGQHRSPDLMSFEVAADSAGKVVTFIFGRDGIEESRTVARVDPKMLREILEWL